MYFPVSFRSLPCSFHLLAFPFICFPVAIISIHFFISFQLLSFLFIGFHVAFIFLSFSFRFLPFPFMSLPFSLHFLSFPFISFHFLSFSFRVPFMCCNFSFMFFHFLSVFLSLSCHSRWIAHANFGCGFSKLTRNGHTNGSRRQRRNDGNPMKSRDTNNRPIRDASLNTSGKYHYLCWTLDCFYKSYIDVNKYV